MAKRKRYCIQKKVSEDKEKRLVVWKDTRKCSNDLETLKLFCPVGYRIYDRAENDKIIFEP